MFFEGKRVTIHRTAKRGNGAPTIVRGVALFVLKLHGDIIAPNGVKFTLFIVYFVVKFRPFARVCVGFPFNTANRLARFIKLISLGIGGFCAPPGKRLAGGGVNLQVLRAFQLAAILIQHVRARRVAGINAFRAACAAVCYIGQAFFIAGDVAIAEVFIIILAGRLSGHLTRIHIVGASADRFSGSGIFLLFICDDPDAVSF